MNVLDYYSSALNAYTVEGVCAIITAAQLENAALHDGARLGKPPHSLVLACIFLIVTAATHNPQSLKKSCKCGSK